MAHALPNGVIKSSALTRIAKKFSVSSAVLCRSTSPDSNNWWNAISRSVGSGLRQSFPRPLEVQSSSSSRLERLRVLVTAMLISRSSTWPLVKLRQFWTTKPSWLSSQRFPLVRATWLRKSSARFVNQAHSLLHPIRNSFEKVSQSATFSNPTAS